MKLASKSGPERSGYSTMFTRVKKMLPVKWHRFHLMGSIEYELFSQHNPDNRMRQFLSLNGYEMIP